MMGDPSNHILRKAMLFKETVLPGNLTWNSILMALLFALSLLFDQLVEGEIYFIGCGNYITLSCSYVTLTEIKAGNFILR